VFDENLWVLENQSEKSATKGPLHTKSKKKKKVKKKRKQQ
jgi:hypothetical protein